MSLSLIFHTREVGVLNLELCKAYGSIWILVCVTLLFLRDPIKLKLCLKKSRLLFKAALSTMVILPIKKHKLQVDLTG